ncbi:MAG: hypothetical protein R2706_04690 [Acidimicrobiales bacterium]
MSDSTRTHLAPDAPHLAPDAPHRTTAPASRNSTASSEIDGAAAGAATPTTGPRRVSYGWCPHGGAGPPLSPLRSAAVR